jgi:putative oxidoreductase
MSLLQRLNLLNDTLARLLSSLQGPALLAIRLWVGWQFFKAGMLKIESWESTLYLFEEEYRVPLLSPHVAAIAGTAGELLFPLLLWAGVATRLAALGLSAVNVMAVVSYAHVLLSEGFEAAFAQHVLWGALLLAVVIWGGGRFALDALAARSGGERQRLGT